MGGNAFKNLEVKRLDKSEFDKVSLKILVDLTNNFPFLNFEIIKSYKNKETFGDLDIIYSEKQKAIYLDLPKEIGKVLNELGTVRNGNVTSYAVPTTQGLFQVDLIKMDHEIINVASSYFAYNDLGNLLGRIFHRAGFKLGHKGLTYVYREDGNKNHVIKEISVTTSWKEALEFAGYDFDVWSKGFNTLEDIFKFVVSIPLANRTIFSLEEMNHDSRVRDRKRKTYNLFLNWINNPINDVPEFELIAKHELRDQWLKRAIKQFPKFRFEMNSAKLMMIKQRSANDKFNGDIVKKITGLESKNLGIFMEDFVNNFVKKECEQTRDDWAISHTNEYIIESIKNWFISKRNE